MKLGTKIFFLFVFRIEFLGNTLSNINVVTGLGKCQPLEHQTSWNIRTVTLDCNLEKTLYKAFHRFGQAKFAYGGLVLARASADFFPGEDKIFQGGKNILLA